MESVCSSCSAFNGVPLLPLPCRLKLASFPSSRYPSNSNLSRRQRRIVRLRVESSRSPRNFIQMSKNFARFSSVHYIGASQPKVEDKSEGNLLESIRKPIVLALWCIAVGLLPFHTLQVPAVAAAPVVGVAAREETRTKKEKEHEYSEYTRKLLEVVSKLLRRIEDVRSSKADMKEVKKALREVKLRKEELQDRILEELNAEQKEMKNEKTALIKRSDKILDSVTKARRKLDNLSRMVSDGEEVKGQMERLEMDMSAFEKEYNGIWEKVGVIEDRILRKETMAFSIGIRELSFMERESEQLVKNFEHELKHRKVERVPGGSATTLSRSDIQRELESAQREYWEKMILPSVLEVEDSSFFLDRNTKDFVLHVKEAFKESRKLQRDLETRVRENMKRFGDEKRFIVDRPADEVVKGFPEIELKWMFGDKEVIVPKAVSLHLYHVWKKWREEAKAVLKKDLLENVDKGKQYVAQRQERILLDRDRVLAKTWYNEERNWWEMDSVAVPYAVSKKLVENVCIRHDWAAMYVTLKGDDKEYYVNIQEFEMLFQDLGGFDGLYLKMLASGIPTAVHLMWIPFSELDIYQQFLLIMRLSYHSVVGLWKYGHVSYARDWIVKKIRDINVDIAMMVFFPIVELIVPYPMRMNLGMAWPEEITQTVGSTWYLKWQSEAEIDFKSRKTDDIQWFLRFCVRSFVYGSVLFNIICFIKRKIPRLLGFGPLRKDPNMQKLRRVVFF